MPEINPQQITFDGGLNAMAPAHLVGENEVQAANNIDFSYERGAASVRRGSNLIWSVSSGTNPLYQIFTYDPATSLSDSLIYFNCDNTIYRGLSGTGSQTFVNLFGTSTASFAGAISGFAGYKQYTHIAVTAGSNCLKDDGTNTFEWPMQAPGGALTITVSTLTALAVATAYGVTEGTIVGTNTATITATTDPATFRITCTATPTSTNLNINLTTTVTTTGTVTNTTTNTNTIGDLGIETLFIGCSNPSAVRRIHRDYSIGDANFTNYWHTEMNVNVYQFLDLDVIGDTSDNAVPDSDVLIDSQLNVGTSTDTNVNLDVRADMKSTARQRIRAPKTILSGAANTLMPWTVPRTKFSLISQEDTPVGWTNIAACRVILECEANVEGTIGGWTIKGAEGWPLNDAENGYAYWETWATFETINGQSVKTSESAPSPTSARAKMQSAKAVIVSTNTATGTQHNVTHRIFYRQGGYLADAYAVATVTYTNGTVTGTTTITGTITHTDSLNDIQALSLNYRLNRDVHSRANFPNNIVALSEPYKERLFIGYLNQVQWSMPGLPSVFPKTSYLTVSHQGDEVKGLVVWSPSVIIVNRDSVYELTGDIFEGRESNFILQRTGSRHGNKAPLTIIKTPYGIPLLDYEGITMYKPGHGVDEPLDWVMEKMADVFRGKESTSPAALKGSRIPALNTGYINRSCAAWMDDRLYFGMVTGTSATYNNTLFVMDFRTKQVWYYTYPFQFVCLYRDQVNNRLFAGTTDGKVMHLEVATQDTGTNGTSTGIAWSLKSRAWTTPNDCVLENISVEHRGANCIVTGIYDSTTTTALGTLTNGTKDWLTPPMLGSIGNNVVFSFAGTQGSGQQQALYNIQWDALLEPKRVEFWRTDYDINQHDGEKIWDVHFADLEIIGTGTVTGTVLVDNTAVLTNTYVGPHGREITPISFPANTFGDVAYTVYRAATGILFKHWQTTYDARNEPPRTTIWKTDIVSLEENICDAMDVDVDPNGTVLSTVYVDNATVGTYTVTGTLGRQSFTFALPNATNTAPHGLYGRTIYALHNKGTGGAMKHYQTWFHLRPEPDRWTNYISDRQSENEQFWQTFEADIDPLDSTVLATVVIDNTAVNTFTMSGNGRKSFAWPIAEDSYGRTIYAAYNASGGGAKFKHYKTWFEGREEPDRLSFVQVGPFMYPSDQYLKTWVADINPLGTCTAVLFADHTALATATFIGTNRRVFRYGLDVNASIALQSSAYEVDIVYTAVGTGAKMKHYDTKFETEPKPFGKKTWAITYKKIGGASQLDMARFWSYDIEASGTGTATFTSIWDIDGTATLTNIVSTSGRRWKDRVAFPPGCRGYLFQQRLLSDTDIFVWKSNLDMMREGVKGLSRASIPGTPNEPTNPSQ